MDQLIGSIIGQTVCMLKQKSKVVLMALGQPSTNPRLLKEALWFSENGCEVFVLYCFWSKWSYHTDKKIVAQNSSIKWIEIGGNPFTKKLVYLFTRCRFKLLRLIASRFPTSLFWAERSMCRCFNELFRTAISIHASLYIAHNLGALPVVGKIASIVKKPFVFDAEDFHRGQSASRSLSFSQASLIESYWMPKARLITTASPFITEQYRHLLGLESLIINNVFCINNSLAINTHIKTPVKLFWFSQTIGKGRGIEDLLVGLKKFPLGSFSITLMGDLSKEMENYLRGIVLEKNDEKVDLSFLTPVEPDKIFEIAANYDIGLAIEPQINENNDLIFTNKLFTYLSSGIAILFTSTSAQKHFFNEHSNIGWIYPSGDIDSLVLVLKQILRHPGELLSYKHNSRQLAAKVYNWETEQAKLMNHMNLINSNA